MAISVSHLSILIADVLLQMGLYTISAQRLLLGTAAVETNLGTYLTQLNGPALGIFQIEPGTEQWLWGYLDKRRPEVAWKIYQISGVDSPNTDALRGNLLYQIALARAFYLVKPDPLPEPQDVEGLAKYWKKHWNTEAGRGTVEKFIQKYEGCEIENFSVNYR